MRAVVALAVLLEGAVAFSTLPALSRETARFEASADAMALEARLWSYNSKTLMGAFPGPRR